MCLVLREEWQFDISSLIQSNLGCFPLAKEPPWLGELFCFSVQWEGLQGVCLAQAGLQCEHHTQRGENCSGEKLYGGVLRRWMALWLLHDDIFLLLFACRIGILRTLRWFQRTQFPLLKWLAWSQPLWWRWTLSGRTAKRGQWVFCLLCLGDCL